MVYYKGWLMSEVMKAIKLSDLENQVVDLRREIKKLEGIIGSSNVQNRFKKKAKLMIPVLNKRMEEIVSEITEMSLLDV